MAKPLGLMVDGTTRTSCGTGSSEGFPVMLSETSSHQALTVFRARMENLRSVMQSPSFRVSTVFEDSLIRYIKPVALDLRVAVETIAPKTADQEHLCRILQEFQTILVSTQNALRDGDTIKPDAIERLSAMSDSIFLLIEHHLAKP